MDIVDPKSPVVSRRAFVQATGGLIVISAGALLLGCGGHGGGGGGKKTAMAKVQVVLPSGSSLGLTTLTLLNGFAQVAIPVGGVVSTTAQSAYASFAVVTDASGNGVLFGFVDPSKRTSVIDAASTAVALLFMRIGGPAVPSSDKAQILALLEAHPATATLAGVIAIQVASDPNAIQNGNAAIGQALEAAHAGLGGATGQAIARAASRADPLPDLLVQPTAPQSGFEVVQDEGAVAVRGINHYRRRCQLLVYRTAETATGGATTSYPQAVAVGTPLDVDGTAALGLFSTVEGLLSGDTAFVPVTTSQILLGLQPGAVRTDFEVVVLGASGSAEPAFFADPKYSAAVAGWRAEVRRLNVLEAIFDVALGYILELWGIRSFFKNDAVVGALYDALYRIEDVTLKTLLARAEAGAYSEVIADTVQLVATSDIVGQGVRNALRPYVTLLQQEAIDEARRTLSQRTLAVALRMINGAFAVVNVGLGAGDLLAVAHDVSTSKPGDVWTVNLVKPTLILSPASASIAPGSRQTFTVKPPAGTTGTLVYDWSQTGTFATLSSADGVVGNSIETSSTSVDLVTTPSDASAITVTVVGYRKGANGSKTEFGRATAKVTLNGTATGTGVLTIVPFITGLISSPDGFGNVQHSVGGWHFLAFDRLPQPSEGYAIQKIVGTNADGSPDYLTVGLISSTDIAGQSVPVLTLDGLLNGTSKPYVNSSPQIPGSVLYSIPFYNLGAGKVAVPYEAFTESDEPTQGIVLGLGELLAKLNADFSSAAPPYRLVRT